MPDATSTPAWIRTLTRHRGLIVPVSFVLLMFVILVPVPPAVMDVLIVLNIALGVIICSRPSTWTEPLDFSVFPRCCWPPRSSGSS